jgi:hypothetical protein
MQTWLKELKVAHGIANTKNQEIFHKVGFDSDEYQQNMRSDFKGDASLFIIQRMASSRMLQRVALVGIGVSEERSACIIRATRIGKLRTLAVTGNRRTLQGNTMLRVGC